MTETTINPAATLIPDQAEVWIVLAEGVTDISTMKPNTPDDDLGALGWSFCGLIDDKKGIPVTPSITVNEYDAFGHPVFRIKLRKGKLQTGFTVLEFNDVTKTFVLPGSAPNKIGAPKDVQVYVLYRFSDGDNATAWMSLSPAPVEVKAHGGVVDGVLSFAEVLVHHTNDVNNDVLEVISGPGVVTGTGDENRTRTFTIAVGVTAYIVTVDTHATASITVLTAAALETALKALPNVGPGGVVVEGPTGGPLVAIFSNAVTTVTAAGTGGTVTVSP